VTQKSRMLRWLGQGICCVYRMCVPLLRVLWVLLLQCWAHFTIRRVHAHTLVAGAVDATTLPESCMYTQYPVDACVHDLGHQQPPALLGMLWYSRFQPSTLLLRMVPPSQ
jgi:hypothetical protein